jgi:hypothetical protein
VHQGIQGLLEDYNNGENRFVIEQMQEFKGKELHSLWNEEREYIIQATPDIEDSLLKDVIDIKSMNKPELLYGPDKSHIKKLAYYMTITDAKKGQLLYVLLTNKDENPFRAYDVVVSDEERARMKQRLIRETRDIEDSIELKDPTLTRHVRFDTRYNWKCDYCSYKMECDEYLINEINLPKDKRRWWDVYERRSLLTPKRFHRKAEAQISPSKN